MHSSSPVPPTNTQPKMLRILLVAAGYVQESAIGAEGLPQLQDPAAERGGPAVQGSAAQPPQDNGEVLLNLQAHLLMLERVQGRLCLLSVRVLLQSGQCPTCPGRVCLENPWIHRGSPTPSAYSWEEL